MRHNTPQKQRYSDKWKEVEDERFNLHPTNRLSATLTI